MAKDDLVTAVVARGRTLEVEGGTQTVGKGAGERKLVLPPKTAKAGEKVTLPAYEVEELIKHGFLVKDPGALSQTALAGPTTLQEGKSAHDGEEA